MFGGKSFSRSDSTGGFGGFSFVLLFCEVLDAPGQVFCFGSVVFVGILFFLSYRQGRVHGARLEASWRL